MSVRSVAIIGAGAAGAVAAAALEAENYFSRITVFERRSSPGGVWIFDPEPGPHHQLLPGKLPPEIDPPLEIPSELPRRTRPSCKERWTKTPIYEHLTTNVPDIAMSFSDSPFPYGPFVPHHVARQYVENYFSLHKTDRRLELNTTVEDLSKIPASHAHYGVNGRQDRWKLTLRHYDPVMQVDNWREDFFDAVVVANGHYSVPYVPYVRGIADYQQKYPDRLMHSKYYRSPRAFVGKKIVVVGNSASGMDVSRESIGYANGPVYVSRRSRSRWDGDEPPPGIVWKPIIKEFCSDGRIIFDDDTWLDNVNLVVYCTGYKASFPFWNEKANGAPIWDYKLNKLHHCYWHTFLHGHPTIAFVGIPRTLTFRSFEYQAVAISRLWSKRNSLPLPPLQQQVAWEQERIERCQSEHLKFHDIPWENGETQDYLRFFFNLAGLGTLLGEGRIPPPLGEDIIWAIEHVRKYPEPPKKPSRTTSGLSEDDWSIIEGSDLSDMTFL